ncbi:MAG: TIGR03032 family protein, partial [Gammaproteobacteria bacterium]
WRWKTGQFTPFHCPHPRWDGSPIPGKTLLIHTEQGAGDAIQFARYLPLAAERAGKLILVCTPDLSPLFATLPGIAEIRGPGTFQLTEFDTHLPLLSLPYVFGSTLGTIPNRIPYIDVALLRRRKTVALPEYNQRPLRIGLVWAGSPTHQHDRNRSCPLMEFLPLLRFPGIAFYSLQKGERSEDLRQLPLDCPVHDLEATGKDFGDTALWLDQLDLLISVDTSVAHLAGALGTPVWLLLCRVPDWRWGLEGETTPWYPGMRLFRQTRRGDWAGVMARVMPELVAWRGGK